MPEIVAEAWRRIRSMQEFEAHQALAWEYRENYDAMAPLLRARLDESKGTTPAAYDEAMGDRESRPARTGESVRGGRRAADLVGARRCAKGLGSTGDARYNRLWTLDGRALRQCSRAHARTADCRSGVQVIARYGARCRGIGGGAVCRGGVGSGSHEEQWLRIRSLIDHDV